MGLMDIFNGFRKADGGVAATGAATNPTVPGASTAQNTTGTGPAAIPAAGTGEQSPLAGYQDLWQIDATKAAPPVNWKPDIKTDPVKLAAAAKSLDFTSSIPAEVMTAAGKGDVTALAAVINHAGRMGFERATETNAGIVNEALEKQAKIYKDEVIPAVLRDYTIGQALRDDNPLYQDPAAAPMLSMVESQLKTKYPTASPAEITTKAKEYVSGFAQVVAKNSGMEMVKPAVVPANKQETNWDKYFSS